MRCPKCGFISFDHLDTCLKCNKDIKSVSENVHGSVYNVSAPAFLKFNVEPEAEEELDEAFFEEGDAFADEEIRDPDLDILLDEGEEDEPELEFAADDSEEEQPGIALSLDDEEDEEGGVAFSLDDFEEDADMPGLGKTDEAAQEERVINIGLPDELSDMSDLEPPPALKEVAEDLVPGRMAEEQDLDLDFDLKLDDEDLGVLAKEEAKSVDLAELTLQDLDLDEEEPKAPAGKKKPAPKKPDIDEDLDFELDLGDLKLDDDE